MPRYYRIPWTFIDTNEHAVSLTDYKKLTHIPVKLSSLDALRGAEEYTVEAELEDRKSLMFLLRRKFQILTKSAEWKQRLELQNVTIST